MISFSFKKIGYWIIILSLVMFFFVMLNFDFFSPLMETWVGVLKWLGLSGLILVIISKEKNETAEIERLRYRWFFQTFFGVLLMIVVFSLSNLLVTDDAVSVDKALTYLKDNDLFKFSVIFLTVHFFAFRRELRKMGNIL
ncbi:hypothetical protein CLV98_1305 [Dyadobacter jejuensis]|uniref:Uncharacterized protein n=2 Tax=Dyadobacter jejuensis TaxID=1082580 RepID=A0A316A6J2_9BACT|nr:hypothetical protein CLV98_1305 [Dyadobacter jejuensis]